MNDRILNLEQAGLLLGVDASQVRRYVRAGRLPSARKVRDAWAVLESDVLDFSRQPRPPVGRPRRAPS